MPHPTTIKGGRKFATIKFQSRVGVVKLRSIAKRIPRDAVAQAREVFSRPFVLPMDFKTIQATADWEGLTALGSVFYDDEGLFHLGTYIDLLWAYPQLLTLYELHAKEVSADGSEKAEAH